MEQVEARKKIDAFLKYWMQRVANLNGMQPPDLVGYKLKGNETTELFIIMESINRCSAWAVNYLQLKYMKQEPQPKIERMLNKSHNATYIISRGALYEFANNFYKVQKELGTKRIIDFRHEHQLQQKWLNQMVN